MQTQAPQAAATPKPTVVISGVPATPRPTVVISGVPGSPDVVIPSQLSSRDVAVLKARREELSTQLQSVDSRRSKLLSQLAGTGDDRARSGLEDRIALLDKRQLQLETDIATTGQQLSSAPAGLVATSGGSPFLNINSGEATALAAIFMVVVLAPIAIVTAIKMLKRSRLPAGMPSALNETADRLSRIEHAVDAIALEVERVSEGQRFVTKLLSEAQGMPALPAAQRNPQAVRAGE